MSYDWRIIEKCAVLFCQPSRAAITVNAMMTCNPSQMRDTALLKQNTVKPEGDATSQLYGSRCACWDTAHSSVAGCPPESPHRLTPQDLMAPCESQR